MPPLKALEQAEFGGVDSRSNPIVFPQKRWLLLVNFLPKPDGHLELREGYTQQPHGNGMGTPTGAIHSMCSWKNNYSGPLVPGGPTNPSHNPDGLPMALGTQCIFFWIGTQPYLRCLDGGACETHNPIIRGNPVASSARWQYALGKDGFLYMHNGTDMKFFDGVYLRDIGLPTLSDAQLANIIVKPGVVSGPSPSDVNGVTFNWGATAGTNYGPKWNGYMYMAFYNTTSRLVIPCPSPLGGALMLPAPANLLYNAFFLNLANIPQSADGTGVTQGLLYYPASASGGSALLCTAIKAGTATLSKVVGIADRVHVVLNAHGFSVSSVFAIKINAGSGGWGGAVQWSSNGPYTVGVVNDANNFEFNSRPGEDVLFDGVNNVTIYVVQRVAHGTTTATVNTGTTGIPIMLGTGLAGELNDFGQPLLQDPTDPYYNAPNLIPASSIGGAQPGYQFWASIYNPMTGHVGNRQPIGTRQANSSPTTFTITGLPDLSVPFLGKEELRWADGTELSVKVFLAGKWLRKQKQGQIIGKSTSPGDSEWRILIGRTGDGGEVPYAIIDSSGNWVTTNTANQNTLAVATSAIDNNSELPTENYIPPPFANFWREGDRLCGSLVNQPWVYRSGSELDATTGIFVGDPAQAWSPARIETFPTADPVWGGFGYAQESWVFSMGHLAQLSELSGEVVWNGPYNRGIIGPYAFDKGWQGLPFWISKDKELCTMLPDGNGPIAISTEYERSLLSQIPDDTITMSLIGGTNYVENFTSYGKGVELVYFSDPPKNIEVLRIKFKQTNGVAVVIIHDFNLRDDLSPYGQGYQSVYQSVLQNDFTSIRILDHQRRARIWAGGNDNYFYQFYKGATDNGVEFPASAITMRYLGGDRTALKTIEWYGDQTIKWYVLDHMLGSDVVADSSQWVDITDQMRPFPGDENSAHWQCDLNRPEMIHCYLWIQLQSHSADAPDPTDPNKLSSPIPHCPLETYGKLYLAAPIIGDTRGR